MQRSVHSCLVQVPHLGLYVFDRHLQDTSTLVYTLEEVNVVIALAQRARQSGRPHTFKATLTETLFIYATQNNIIKKSVICRVSNICSVVCN